MKKIIVNKIKCNKCGDIIESTYRHDYLRRCGDLDSYEDLSVTEEIELDEKL